MDTVVTILVFVGSLAILIFIHELGHFIAARIAKVRVDEFGIGFPPPRLFKFRRGPTLYSLNPWFLGGFVRIFGEDGEGRGDPASFVERPPRTRFKILLAGVAANWILGAIILSLLSGIGAPVGIADTEAPPSGEPARVQIGQVAKHSPAADAGIRIGDTIKELSSGQTILVPSRVSEVQDFIKEYQGSPIHVILERGKEKKEYTLVPRVSPPEGEGPLGVSLMRTITRKIAWYEVPWQGVFSAVGLTIQLAAGVFTIFHELITEGVLVGEVAGPIGIAALSGQIFAIGWSHYLLFLAVLSLNLALLNLVPFPALDGGRAFFVALEGARGKPISPQLERAIHQIGFTVLIAFVLWISFRDISQII